MTRDRDLAIPKLPSRSLARTRAFYAKLGFEGELLEQGAYLILTRGDLELHFFPHPDLVPADSWAGCYLRVLDVDATYLEMSQALLPAQGIPRMDVVEDKPWRMREFAVIDEDGNLVQVGTPLPD